MTYANLRALIKNISPPVDYTLKNCELVIDGRSFFKDAYKNSGCHSILGGEYDRYADYLKNLLKPFKNSNVTCYVIFNGGMEADLEKRKEIHHRVIKNAKEINPEDDKAYVEPIFAKNVWKEVLDELEIKYFVTEYDSWNAIFYVANIFKCPVLTKNYEYSLRFTDCISPKSLKYQENSNKISCTIFTSANVRNNFRVKHTVLPLFYTLLDESSSYFKKLSVIVDCIKPRSLLPKVLKWTRWAAYNLEEILQKVQSLLSEEECQDFFNAYQKNEELCKTTKHTAAVKHFQQNKKIGNDKIPIPYINLICNGTFSGSWLIFDKDQDDAMVPALNMIFYACKCLKLMKNLKVTFIGRQNEESCVWEIDLSEKKIQVNNSDLFKNFVYESMPGFDFKNLETVPEDCWILIVTLIYYCRKRMDISLAYSILLSYVMMGPVSENIGLIKRSKFMCPEVDQNGDQEDKNGLKTKDCVAVVDSLMDLFYVNNLKRHFDRKILHTFAEFHHCLQHMNYLNKLCGQKIKCTVFHKTINATFAYNMYLKIKDISDVNKYFEKRLKKSSVFSCYKKIQTAFEACLLSVGLELVGKMESLKTAD